VPATRLVWSECHACRIHAGLDANGRIRLETAKDALKSGLIVGPDYRINNLARSNLLHFCEWPGARLSPRFLPRFLSYYRGQWQSANGFMINGADTEETGSNELPR
jgi:hypothetical protein